MVTKDGYWCSVMVTKDVSLSNSVGTHAGDRWQEVCVRARVRVRARLQLRPLFRLKPQNPKTPKG